MILEADATPAAGGERLPVGELAGCHQALPGARADDERRGRHVVLPDFQQTVLEPNPDGVPFAGRLLRRRVRGDEIVQGPRAVRVDLPVAVSLIVQDLNFRRAEVDRVVGLIDEDEDSAVATLGDAPVELELEIAEGLAGDDVAGARGCQGEGVAVYFPAGVEGVAVVVAPVVEGSAVEEGDPSGFGFSLSLADVVASRCAGLLLCHTCANQSGQNGTSAVTEEFPKSQ